GPEHHEVAYPLHGLAILYKQQGKYTEAEFLYQRALSIREEALGPEHRLTVATQASYQRLLQDWKKAEGESEAKK
ncbi:MAG TPA: tetratricopeptide repeat protein, partial [Ktedonobacteraceae bacterium]|nr:tetratricopeptide repeat protein [Ktedonobacteraceae bacterium]